MVMLVRLIGRYGLGANAAEEALYMPAFIDANGTTLKGGTNYVIHFTPAQIPPVNPGGFWSITAYNSTQRLMPNPINVYQVGKYSQGLKKNTDGSLDIYVQPQSPGQAKQSNWLPSPTNSQSFNLLMRLY
jgi:hypothetical protein